MEQFYGVPDARRCCAWWGRPIRWLLCAPPKSPQNRNLL